MTRATITLARPPALRTFLGAGCMLSELLDDDRMAALAEQAVETPRLFSVEDRARRAGMWRGILDDWLSDPAEHLRYSENPQLDLTGLAWRIELLEDPELPALVQSALPAALVDEVLARVEAQRRPFVFLSELRSTFRCSVCGEAHERSRGVRLAPRSPSWPAVEDLPDLMFCPACIAAAAGESRSRSASAAVPRTTLPKLSTALDRVGFVRRKLQEEGFAEKSIRHYTRELMRAEYWCEDHGWTLRNVPDADFARYVETRPRSTATRRSMKAALGHYWRWIPRKNPPLWLVRVPKARRMVSKATTEEEARAVVRAARARGDRQGLAVLLGLFVGLRREEIASVRWDDLAEERGGTWLKVIGKGEVSALLPVHPVVLEMLGRLDRLGSPWVFPGRFGGPVKPATVWTWVKALGRELGMDDLRPHVLRHTCLSVANDETGDLRAVQEFARHARPDTTSGYTRATAKRLLAVMTSLDAYLDDEPTPNTDELTGD